MRARADGTALEFGRELTMPRSDVPAKATARRADEPGTIPPGMPRGILFGGGRGDF